MLMYSTRSGFLTVHIAMLPRTFTITNTIPCNVSTSHEQSVTLHWGPTCSPLGHTPSISANTKNIGDAHNAWEFISPHIVHHHLPILALLIGAIFNDSLIMLN